MRDKKGDYKGLGRRLKLLRTRAKQSLAETSGAVEIDVRQLANYELGQSRPSEDVLLLLISHFGAKDDEAIKMWELAGYVSESKADLPLIAEDSQITKPENQILFTDVVDVTVNNYGVVMNFMQGTGPSSGPQSVARVGMSREHAKSVLQILQMTLSQTERGTKDLTNKTTNPSENKNP